MAKTILILNTLDASGANDITLENRVITLLESAVVKTSIPNILSISSANGILDNLVETAQVIEVAYTAANATTYAFTVSQVVDGLQVNHPVEVTTAASGTTDASLATDIINAFNESTFSNNGSTIKVTAAGAGTPLTFTADAGFPLFQIVAISNVTVSAAQPALETITSVSNAAPRVVVSTAHGLASGQTITLSGATGAGLADVNKQHRVTVVDADSYTLDGTTATGAVAGTIVGVEDAQESRGSNADITAVVAANPSAQVIGSVGAGVAYSTIEVGYGVPSRPLLGAQRSIEADLVIYASQNSETAPTYTATSNYATWATRAEKIFGALDAGTAALAEAVAVL